MAICEEDVSDSDHENTDVVTRRAAIGRSGTSSLDNTPMAIKPASKKHSFELSEDSLSEASSSGDESSSEESQPRSSAKHAVTAVPVASQSARTKMDLNDFYTMLMAVTLKMTTRCFHAEETE